MPASKIYRIVLPYDSGRDKEEAAEMLDLLRYRGCEFIARIEDRGPIGGRDLVVEVI